MKRYMIVLRHQDDYEGCVQALRVIDHYGAHLLTRADWGCHDGIHSGWIVVEVGSREEALRLVPPELRSEVEVVQLNRFTREEIASMVAGLEH